MHLRVFKYYSPLLIAIGSVRAFTSTGIWCWSTLFYAWILIPMLELIIKPDESNLDAAEEELARNDPAYDWVLYFIAIIQWVLLYLFLQSMEENIGTTDRIGRILTMGLACGTFGINVAHELGHRINGYERVMAKALLLSSLYMHFFIEHNKGHHKRVGTMEDPATARFGESVYAFFIRSILFSYLDSWRIAGKDCRKKGIGSLSVTNEMVQMQLIQFALLVAIGWYWSVATLLYFVAAAVSGILLLEMVNYIEHYGLMRNKDDQGRYQRTGPEHSWNSNHVIGRLMLFELSRHSDHHYLASRKYQLLRHHDHAPQLPTGYPGMMMLSLIPPLWFRVMNKRVIDTRQFSGR